MDFITIEQVESKKNKEDIVAIHNAQVFFNHITHILAKKENEKMRKKYAQFFEFFTQHLRTDNKIRFVEVNGRYIVSMPEAKLIYYKDDVTKPVRIIIQKKEVE